MKRNQLQKKSSFKHRKTVINLYHTYLMYIIDNLNYLCFDIQYAQTWCHTDLATYDLWPLTIWHSWHQILLFLHANCPYFNIHFILIYICEFRDKLWRDEEILHRKVEDNLKLFKESKVIWGKIRFFKFTWKFFLYLYHLS